MSIIFQALLYIIFFSLVVLSSQVMSDTYSDMVSQSQADTRRDSESVLNKHKQQAVSKKTSKQKTFMPSEKINADSVVSFPVDI